MRMMRAASPGMCSPAKRGLPCFVDEEPAAFAGSVGVAAWLALCVPIHADGVWRDVEPGLPDKLELVEAIKRLSEAFGSERVIWRYDPVFFSGVYSLSWHVRCFDALAERLEGVTRTCVVSFLDMYPKLRRRIPALGLCGDSGQARKELLAAFAAMAERRGIRLSLCAEDVDAPGVVHAGCLSRELAERVAGCRLDVRPSQQREGCKCVASVDVACTAPAGTDASIVTPIRTASPWGGLGAARSRFAAACRKAFR